MPSDWSTVTELGARRGRPITIDGAALSFGDRPVWSGLDLTVEPGEFVTVLGSNGSGKSTLLKAVLGLRRLDAGSIDLGGESPHRTRQHVGYMPQQRLIAAGTPMRGRDLVALGVDGHRFGIRLRRAAVRRAVDAAIATVHGEELADRPVGELSGGEQQRLRIAQMLVGEPEALLCDEPLASLDLHHQRVVCDLIDEQRRAHDTPVLFVTHDVNPVLEMTDRILYLADGRHRIGTPDEVLRSDVLSDLYRTPVDVLRVGGRVVVLGTNDHPHHERQAS